MPRLIKSLTLEGTYLSTRAATNRASTMSTPIKTGYKWVCLKSRWAAGASRAAPTNTIMYPSAALFHPTLTPSKVEIEMHASASAKIRNEQADFHQSDSERREPRSRRRGQRTNETAPTQRRRRPTLLRLNAAWCIMQTCRPENASDSNPCWG